jgi:hypothetical protein
MTIYKMNPSGDEISAAGHSSHASYHRARKRQERLDAWENRNAANSTAPSERASRLPAHLDHEYCGSYTQRALHQVQQEAAPAPPPSLIPALSPQDEKDARDAYEWYFYPHTLSDDRKRWAVKFAAALHLVVPGETWAGLDSVRRNIITQIIESAEAKVRFQPRQGKHSGSQTQ